MIYDAPIYDLDELARYNLHTHTTFSACARPEMTLKNIVAAAEAAGLEMIALTDHYNHRNFDAKYLRQIARLKNEFVATGSKLRVLFSSELSCWGAGQFLEKQGTRDSLDYGLYTCNHYHLDFWEHPADTSPRGYAVHLLKCAEACIESGRAECIAHPLIGRFVRLYHDPTEITRAMEDGELYGLCALAAKRGVALELNAGAVMGDPGLFTRLWKFGKEAGTTFHFGTDAHRLVEIDTRKYLPELKRILE